jgi:hypothetical protein
VATHPTADQRVSRGTVAMGEEPPSALQERLVDCGVGADMRLRPR